MYPVFNQMLQFPHCEITKEPTKIFTATHFTAFALEDIAESCNYGLDEESR